MKKILALLLCFIMILTSLISCGDKKEEKENDGAEIKMYISDPIYNFDPAEAYKNEASLKIVSLIFDNLFIIILVVFNLTLSLPFPSITQTADKTL